MIDIGRARELVGHPQVVAFSYVVRNGESSLDDSAWTVLYGGDHFTSFDDHPRIRFPIVYQGKPNYTTAAGALQIVERSWNDFTKAYGPMPFTPENQMLFLVWRLDYRKALDAVLAGRLSEAIRLCIVEWTSLGLQKIQAQAAQIFTRYGGSLAPVSANPDSPATEKVTPILGTSVPKEGSMAPALLLGLLELAGKYIPVIAEKFGSGSDVANRNIAAGKVLGEAIVEATKSASLGEAVSKLETDPQAASAANAAVAEVWPSLFEAGGGGIDGARKAAAAGDGDWKKVFISVPMTVIVMLMPLVYFVVYHVIVGKDWSVEIKASVVSAIISGVLFAIVGFALGTSYGSQKKDAALASRGNQ